MKKAAIVTGASGGIGQQIAKSLAFAGWSVLINYNRNKEAAESLCAQLNEQGCRTLCFKADVGIKSEVEQMKLFTEEKLGEIELVINNAGIAYTGLFQSMSDESWNRVINTNLNGVRNVISAVLPSMIEKHNGNIINISSIWGSHAASCEVCYACTKAAIESLTRSLAAELAPCGIRINCVAPGCIATDMTLSLGDETVEMLKRETPLQRLGTAKDVGNAVLFLASDASSFITGQVLTVDGGFTL